MKLKLFVYLMKSIKLLRYEFEFLMDFLNNLNNFIMKKQHNYVYNSCIVAINVSNKDIDIFYFFFYCLYDKSVIKKVKTILNN